MNNISHFKTKSFLRGLYIIIFPIVHFLSTACDKSIVIKDPPESMLIMNSSEDARIVETLSLQDITDVRALISNAPTMNYLIKNHQTLITLKTQKTDLDKFNTKNFNLLDRMYQGVTFAFGLKSTLEKASGKIRLKTMNNAKILKLGTKLQKEKDKKRIR